MRKPVTIYREPHSDLERRASELVDRAIVMYRRAAELAFPLHRDQLLNEAARLEGVELIYEEPESAAAVREDVDPPVVVPTREKPPSSSVDDRYEVGAGWIRRKDLEQR